MGLLDVPLDAPSEHQNDALLLLRAAVHRRRHRISEKVQDVWLCRDCLDLFHVLGVDVGLLLLLLHCDVVGDEHGVEVLAGTGLLHIGLEHADDDDAVPRLHGVDKVILNTHLHRARQLTRRRRLGRLLQCEALNVLEQTQPEFGAQDVAQRVLAGHHVDRGEVFVVHGRGHAVAVEAAGVTACRRAVVHCLNHTTPRGAHTRDNTRDADHVLRAAGLELAWGDDQAEATETHPHATCRDELICLLLAISRTTAARRELRQRHLEEWDCVVWRLYNVVAQGAALILGRGGRYKIHEIAHIYDNAWRLINKCAVNALCVFFFEPIAVEKIQTIAAQSRLGVAQEPVGHHGLFVVLKNVFCGENVFQ
eukprot:PhM_4_TR11524/c0_g1_i2/m.92847